jgi:hypothetical protein
MSDKIRQKNNTKGGDDSQLLTSADDDKQKKHTTQTYIKRASFFNIIAILSLALATVLYIVTLIGCPDTQAECLKNFDQTKIKYYAMSLIISAALYTFTYNLVLYRRIHYIFALGQTSLLWFLCYVYDTGTDLKSHGQYNRTFLFAIMVICFVVQNFLYAVYLLAMKKPVVGVTILVVLTLGSGLIIHHKLVTSCNMWALGLKEEVAIDNTLPGCKIKHPRYCWMNFLDNLADVSGWLGENCEQIRMDNKKQLVQWTKIPNAQVIGFPRTEKWKFYPDSTLDQFQFKVLYSTIDMENKYLDEKVKNKTEITVDFNKQPPEVDLRIAVDEQLITKREQVYNSFKDKTISKNVVFIFIDSLSRDNFRRKLKKTKAWLEKYYNNKKSEAEVFQFMKYHGVASWTLINMIPTMFGVEVGHIGRPNHFLKYYKERGFITGQGLNYCGRELMDLEPGNHERFNFEAFDHEVNPLFCDPNFCVPGHPFAILNGPYSMKRRCLYGKDTHSYVFDYGKKFWKAYNDQPKMLRIAFQDAHEGTGEVVKYLDDKLVDFLEMIESEGSLKETTIIIQADHGVNMPGLYTFFDSGDFWIEKTLPSLFLITPRNVADTYGSTLKDKEQVMLSPYDVHNTLLHLSGAPRISYNKIGESFFNPITNIQERTCDKIRVVDPYCNCIGERDS